MHVEWIEGSGPQVLLLPGTPQPPDALKPLADALASRGRTVGMVIPPGYAGTDPEPGPIDPDKQHARLLEQLGDEGFVAVGNSAGAYRALRLAMDGASVQGLVLLAPFTGPATDEERIAWRGLAPLVRSDADLSGVVRERWLSKSERTRPDADGIVDWMNATSRENLANELEAMADLPDLVAACSAVTAPVRVLVGDEDLGFQVEAMRRLARALPNGELEVVHGAGHCLSRFHLERVLAAVESVLERADR